MTNTALNNKRIAKNTLLLYFRMLFTMAVSLYTSRVILNVLGVDDFGIYNVVGGVIGMFGFVYSAMSSSTQRYITFELGRKNYFRLQKVFSTSMQTHIILAIIIMVISETIGLWFINEKMIIPHDRLNAAMWVFQCSILSTMVMVVSVPYNALIIAYEKMSAFAYISILEVTLKLLIVYLLVIGDIDKLKLYAVLTLGIQLLIRFTYNYYCKKHFSHIKIKLKQFEPGLLKEMLSFASWNLWGGCAGVMYSQGINLLLNVFFGPTVNAARAVAVQVENAILQFSTNLQMAINPQITKTYAQGDLAAMHKLLTRSSKFTFILLFLLSLPIIIETNSILALWLKIVPKHTVTFLRLILITTIIDSMARPLMQAAGATGKVRRYQSIVGSVLLTILPISYIALKLGAKSEAVFVIHLVICCIAFIVRLYIIKSMIKLNILDFFSNTVMKAFLISLLSIPIPLLIHYYMPTSFLTTLCVCFTCFIIVSTISYKIGLDNSEKAFINTKMKVLIQNAFKQ